MSQSTRAVRPVWEQNKTDMARMSRGCPRVEPRPDVRTVTVFPPSPHLFYRPGTMSPALSLTELISSGEDKEVITEACISVWSRERVGGRPSRRDLPSA